jgi:hypothetical protein
MQLRCGFRYPSLRQDNQGRGKHVMVLREVVLIDGAQNGSVPPSSDPWGRTR